MDIFLVFMRRLKRPALDQIFRLIIFNGEVGEWSNPADCKSAAYGFEGSNPSLTTTQNDAGVAQLARASAFQADCRRFESGLPLHFNLLLIDELLGAELLTKIFITLYYFT